MHLYPSRSGAEAARFDDVDAARATTRRHAQRLVRAARRHAHARRHVVATWRDDVVTARRRRRRRSVDRDVTAAGRRRRVYVQRAQCRR